jgi:uncharacterized membrane protein
VTPLIRGWRRTTLAVVVLLIAIVFGWQLSPMPTAIHFVDAALLSLPLFAPLPGLWHGNRRTYRWATLCALPYFVVGITEAIATPPSRVWSVALLGVTLLWFFALIGYLRATNREAA